MQEINNYYLKFVYLFKIWHGGTIQDRWVNDVAWLVCGITFCYMTMPGRLFKRSWPSFHPSCAKLCILGKQHCVQVDVDKRMTPALTTDLPKAVSSSAGAPGHPQRSEQRPWAPLCVSNAQRKSEGWGVHELWVVTTTLWVPHCDGHGYDW